RGGDPRRARGQPLPLHRLHDDRRGGPLGRGAPRRGHRGGGTGPRWRGGVGMIPAPFSYARAGSVEEAIALLGEHGDEAKVLAGGQSRLPLMKLRLAGPSVLVDLGRVPGLQGVRQEGDVVVVGALTRHRDLERDPLLAERAPLLHHAAGTVGDPQVRSRGTIGGSIAHADPAADYPAVLLALDAEVVVQGPSGTRVVAARDLFVGYFETTLAETELITEVRVPVHDGFGYAKFRRRAQDWAVVGAA